MKREFGYSEGDDELVIYSHAGLFYLKHGKQKLARTDDIKVLKAYIDGFSHGKDVGVNKYFDKYIELKQKLKKAEGVN